MDPGAGLLGRGALWCNLLRGCLAVFQSGCTVLAPQQQSLGARLPPPPVLPKLMIPRLCHDSRHPNGRAMVPRFGFVSEPASCLLLKHHFKVLFPLTFSPYVSRRQFKKDVGCLLCHKLRVVVVITTESGLLPGSHLGAHAEGEGACVMALMTATTYDTVPE